MTRKRGSSVARSIRTRSIAPGAARWPPRIWAPSKAGPVGLEAASSRSRLPRTISAFVPTSTTSVDPLGLVRRLGEDHAGGVGADVAGDARQDVDPGARDGRAGRARAAVVRTARSVASANGAPPSGVGSMPSRR